MKYNPRVSHKPVMTLYIVCALFFLIALSLIVFVGKDALAASITLMIFTSLIFFVVWLQASGKRIVYQISSEGILLRRSWSKKTIPFNEIVVLKKISKEEAEEIAYNADDDRIVEQNNFNVIGAFKKQIEFGYLTTYSSVPFVTTEYSRVRRVISHSANTIGDFIYIGTKERAHIVSPLELDEFLNDALKFSNGILKRTLVEGKSILSAV